MGDSRIEGQLTPKLIDGLYVEAMVLADEARSYFDTIGRDDRLSLESTARPRRAPLRGLPRPAA